MHDDEFGGLSGPGGAARPTLVLIAGAWHGAWLWDKVVPLLGDLGWTVQTIDLPSVAALGEPRHGMLDDAAAVRRHLEAIDGPVVLVAHSYAGMPVTQAAAGLSHVRHIIYVAAFQLDVGDSLLGVFGAEPDVWNVDGDTITVNDPIENMYADVPPGDAAWAQGQLLPSSYLTVTEALSAAAWRDTPSTYVVCERDQAFPPQAQEQIAAGRASEVRRLPSGHTPMLSYPVELTLLIADVAAAAA